MKCQNGRLISEGWCPRKHFNWNHIQLSRFFTARQKRIGSKKMKKITSGFATPKMAKVAVL
jgi:hypothetical protein